MIRRTWIQMGMPVTVCIQDGDASEADVEAVSDWFEEVNQRFSLFLETSEVARLNAGTIGCDDVSDQLAEVLRLCEQTKIETGGYFDAARDGRIDPSGLVKGWAIERAAALVSARGRKDFFVDAGGDVQAVGCNGEGRPWRVGIRNPFKRDEQVKVLAISNRGVATSGTAIRGRHIYNPMQSGFLFTDVVSLTVIGPTIYEADRFATAAFAMGREGLAFIAGRPNLEGYATTADGMAQFTDGFNHYVR
jgi:FAD:protein FMN transferase